MEKAFKNEGLFSIETTKYHIHNDINLEKILEMKNVLVKNGFKIEDINVLPFYEFQNIYDLLMEDN